MIRILWPSSRSQNTTKSVLCKEETPRRKNRSSLSLCSGSNASCPCGSAQIVLASSNQTPCFSALLSFFSSSHSKVYFTTPLYANVYTICKSYFRGYGASFGRMDAHLRPPGRLAAQKAQETMSRTPENDIPFCSAIVKNVTMGLKNFPAVRNVFVNVPPGDMNFHFMEWWL